VVGSCRLLPVGICAGAVVGIFVRGAAGFVAGLCVGSPFSTVGMLDELCVGLVVLPGAVVVSFLLGCADGRSVVVADDSVGFVFVNDDGDP